MADRDRLGELRPIADEAFAGLHADEALRRRILRGAQEQPRPRLRMPGVRVLAPAACALLFAALGVSQLRDRSLQPVTLSGGSNALRADGAVAGELLTADGEAPVLDAASAGGEVPEAAQPLRLADLSGTTLHKGARGGTLFEEGEPEIPLLALNGAFYRLLREPAVLSDALLGGEIGTVQNVTEHPSLATREQLQEGLSNCCPEGAEIRSIRGLSEGTAVACRTQGQYRLFQRVSYAGTGAAGMDLEDTLDVRGRVKEMTLSGVGTLSGDAAEAAAAYLLDNARLAAASAEGGSGTLTLTLQSGLKLQMTADGDRLVACGAWNCAGLQDLFR